MKMKKYQYLLWVSLFLFSCGSDKNEPLVVAPTNLTFDVKQVGLVGGQIELTATALNANFFDFDPGDNKLTTPLLSNTGKFSYTYQQSGNYNLKVRAFATTQVFIEASKNFSVLVNNHDGLPTTGYSTPETYEGYTLVWKDEFKGTTLSSDWTHETGTGTGGWGNNELQFYRAENTVVQNDLLIITAKKEDFGGQQYTSSRIITRGKRSFKYGRIDIRAVMPEGQGIWPALWMLGENISSVGWPKCGEIDIMEMIGGSPTNDKTVHGTAHWDNNGSHASFGKSYVKESGKLSENFHVYSIIWDETKIRWYFDDILYNTIDITPADLNELKDNHFFFIFNVAVGGNWPGAPNESTKFPQRMAVDYVRVFQRN
ncbi:MAG: hypothetical protein OHK0038_03930 [Flammeovirgaceae bacterium]